MSNSKTMSTSLANHIKLSLNRYPKTDEKAEYMLKVSYVMAIGCLMYVMIYIIPDLEKVISQVCKFMSIRKSVIENNSNGFSGI